MRRCRWLGVLSVVFVPTWGVGSERQATDAVAPEQQVITVRGEPMKVWPNDNLRESGFDVPAVPRGENAYWTYLEAINLYKSVPDELDGAFSYAYGTAWPEAQAEKLQAFLLEPENQKAMALARQASAMEKFEPMYFGDPAGSIISVLLPNLSAYRHLSKMLVADGRRLEEQGACDLALQNYVAVMRMGHHVGRGFTLIEGLVGVACWAIGDQAVSELVLRRELHAEQLREILKRTTALYSLRPSAVRGIENERLFGSLIVDELTYRPSKILANANAFSGGGPSDVHRPSDSWGQLEARLGRLMLPDRTIKKHLMAHYDRLVELGHKPAYEARWADFDEEAAVMAIPRWDVIAHMLLPSLSRAATLGERCRTQSLATRLVVALRLFAKEHEGAAPLRLDDLHDLIPAEDLIDPFSGKPFVYKRDGDAWLFYSFSDNLKDDGGQEGERKFEPDHVRRYPPADIEPFEPESTE